MFWRRRMRHKLLLIIGLLVLASMVLAACGAISATPIKETVVVIITQVVQEEAVKEEITVNATPEPEVVEPRTLVICLGQEPDTLYPYGTDMLASSQIQEAIWDGPIDSLSFSHQPVIYEKLASLVDGDAVINTVEVVIGDKIVDNNDQVVELAAGVTVRPAGCYAADCAIEWDGNTVLQMEQMVVTTKLLPGLVWSDGTPLTSADQIYSFELASDLDTNVDKYEIERTASYVATNDVTTVWTGLPGFRDSTYFLNVWTPYPKHIWGQYTPTELTSEVDAQGLWIGWGAYKVQEWVRGDHLTVVKNENYFRAGDGLPKFESVIYRFVGATPNTNLAMVLKGECDIVDQTSSLDDQSELLIELDDKGLLNAAFGSGALWEHVDFNIRPLEGAGFAGLDEDGDGLGPFGDVRLRQAIAMCMDRQAVVDSVLFGQSVVMHTYLLPQHPLYNTDARQWLFDITTASTLLDEIGWKDDDGNPSTPRVALGVTGVPDDTRLEFSYGTNDTDMRMEIGQALVDSLAQCGIKVNLDYYPSFEWIKPGPEGVLFGRKTDLGQFAWPISFEPPCYLYMSENIPGDPGEVDGNGDQVYPNGWDGKNQTGYSNPEFDDACIKAMQALPGQAGYDEGHKEAQRIFAEDLPVVPLFPRINLAITRPDMCGFIMDPTTISEMWNIEEFDYGDCATGQ